MSDGEIELCEHVDDGMPMPDERGRSGSCPPAPPRRGAPKRSRLPSNDPESEAREGEVKKKKTDDEISDYPLMGSPGPVLIIITFYLVFVLKVGPKYMRKREAYKLTNTLLVYNAVQVALSAYMVQMYFRTLLTTGLIPKQCYMNDVDLRKHYIFGIWFYFAAKVSELLDTIFFVLRKKSSQITFLHLYHHSIMVVGTFAMLKYWPSQSLFFIGFLNSLVHVFMYTYYGLAALGPRVTKYLIWKKYMTKFQLIQFVSIIIQYVSSVTVSECPPARGVAAFIACNTVFILVLFVNFYVRSYTKKKFTELWAKGVCKIAEVDSNQKVQ